MSRSSTEHRTARYWVSAWLPVALAILVIATESTPAFGSDRTSGPFRWVFEHLFGTVSDARWWGIHHLIRKTGHFTGYGLVGITWLRALWLSFDHWSFLRSSALAIAGTALIAGSDELHQTFLPNRTGLFSDVILDCCGALILQLVAYAMLRVFRPRILMEHAD